MDILVLLEDGPERAPPDGPGSHAAPPGLAEPAADAGSDAPVAHVNSMAATPYAGESREVVTLYGAADAETLALALAAAVEGRRAGGEPSGAIRHLDVWRDRGAVGDSAWRDQATGQLRSRDLAIAPAVLAETARELLAECGARIRQTVAGLAMPDWPEGMRRAIQFTCDPSHLVPAGVGPGADALGADALLDAMREADGNLFEGD